MVKENLFFVDSFCQQMLLGIKWEAIVERWVKWWERGCNVVILPLCETNVFWDTTWSWVFSTVCTNTVKLSHNHNDNHQGSHLLHPWPNSRKKSPHLILFADGYNLTLLVFSSNCFHQLFPCLCTLLFITWRSELFVILNMVLLPRCRLNLIYYPGFSTLFLWNGSPLIV